MESLNNMKRKTIPPPDYQSWIGARRRQSMVEYVYDLLMQNVSEKEVCLMLSPYFAERKIYEYIRTAKQIIRFQQKDYEGWKQTLEKAGIKEGDTIEISIGKGEIVRGKFKELALTSDSIFPWIVVEWKGEPISVNTVFVNSIGKVVEGEGGEKRGKA